MAWDIEKLQNDSRDACANTTLMTNTVSEFRVGNVAGVAHTTAQKQALRTKFVAEHAAAQVALAAVKVQIGANS